jgi:hypothetical protein
MLDDVRTLEPTLDAHVHVKTAARAEQGRSAKGVAVSAGYRTFRGG